MLKVTLTVRIATFKVLVVERPFLRTGGIRYHAQLGLPIKGHSIKGLVFFNMVGNFGPAKRFGPRLLSTIPSGFNHIHGYH